MKIFLFQVNFRKGPSTKTKAEEIVIHCLIFVTVFFIGMLLFQVWKYLNSKALASKTVLDDLAKDCTIILGLALITSWVTWMKIAEEYNYYVAMGIVRSGLALRIGLMAQGMAFSTVRYLFLFHFEDINSVDENTIKLVARVFALILALLCAVFEDFSKNIKFLYLTEINIDKNLVYQSSISTHVMLIISLFVIFFVQGRIVYFKWKHPDPPQNQNVNDQYNLKAISFACFIALIQFSVLICSYCFCGNYRNCSTIKNSRFLCIGTYDDNVAYL